MAETVAATLRGTKVYDLLVESGKVVVFDVAVPLNIIVFSFVEHQIISAPLWDSEAVDFGGTVTVRDIARFLRRFHRPGTAAAATALTQHTFLTWTDPSRTPSSLPESGPTPPVVAPVPTKPGGAGAGSGAGSGVGAAGGLAPSTTASGAPCARMPFLDPEQSLVSACTHMQAVPDIDVMPVVDVEQMAVLTMLGLQPILQCVMSALSPGQAEALFGRSVRECGVGTFEGLVTAPTDEPLINVLARLLDARLTTLPLVDPGSGAIIDTYSLHDVTFLARDRSLQSLDRPVGELRARLLGGHPAPPTCSASDSLLSVVNHILTRNVVQVFVVDDHGRPVGVVALKDVARYLLAIVGSVPEPPLPVPSSSPVPPDPIVGDGAPPPAAAAAGVVPPVTSELPASAMPLTDDGP